MKDIQIVNAPPVRDILDALLNLEPIILSWRKGDRGTLQGYIAAIVRQVTAPGKNNPGRFTVIGATVSPEFNVYIEFDINQESKNAIPNSTKITPIPSETD